MGFEELEGSKPVQAKRSIRNEFAPELLLDWVMEPDNVSRHSFCYEFELLFR